MSRERTPRNGHMIEVKDLTRSFGERKALQGISFSIKEGEFYGLLGPNGAGKTTTISIISTILEPDSGSVLVNGNNIHDRPNEVKGMIGVVPQEIALYNDLSALENLMFWGSLYFIPKRELKERVKEALTLVGLFDRRKDKVGGYSGGMKRRINIAAAMLHRPRIIVMDEPTVGIDPQSRNLVIEVINALHRDGATIVYTTHHMEEAERLCDRIGIMDDGRIIAEGTLEELKQQDRGKETIILSMSNMSDDLATRIRSFWPDSQRVEERILCHTTDLNADLPGIIAKCNEAGAGITNIALQRMDLETIFLNLTGKQLRD